MGPIRGERADERDRAATAAGVVLSGLVAITGAAGGIGRALCDVLRDRGFRLHLIDRDGTGLQALAETHGATWHEGAARSAAQARAALAGAAGPLHGFVHLAGAMTEDPRLGDDPQVWEAMMADNLTNAYHFATALDERLEDGRLGRLVFTSSLAFRRGAVDAVAYSAAKGGLVGMTRALARRFARKATVNAVAPGIIETRMPAAVIAKRRDRLLAEIPLGRFGAPEEVGRVIAFLLGPDATYVNGQTINIDGGQIMT